MNSPIVAIDVFNMLYRHYHAMKYTQQSQSGIFGLLRDLRIIAQMTQSVNFVFCFDSPDCVRKRRFPFYKQGRKDSESRKEVQALAQKLGKEVLPQLGYVNALEIDGAEADDLMGMICQQRNGEICLVSNDADLYQLLDHQGVTIWNPSTKFMITENWLQTQHDLQPCEWPIYKALMGCKTDDIPGVPGIGPARAASYIRGRLLSGPSLTSIKKNEKLIQDNLLLTTLPTPLLGDKVSRFQLSEQQEIPQDRWDYAVTKFQMSALIGKRPV